LHRFLNIAKGSLAELETQLIIARELEFADGDRIDKVMTIAEQESRMLSGLLRSVDETL
jgi:four helix bundle protein